MFKKGQNFLPEVGVFVVVNVHVGIISEVNVHITVEAPVDVSDDVLILERSSDLQQQQLCDYFVSRVQEMNIRGLLSLEFQTF